MFRGLLYRYLRERSRHRGLIPSAVLSALFSSFLFAAIHPQGLAVVPVLMGLACGFCLAREWRGSLLSSMAAHGLNNYVALSMARLVLGGWGSERPGDSQPVRARAPGAFFFASSAMRFLVAAQEQMGHWLRSCPRAGQCSRPK